MSRADNRKYHYIYKTTCVVTNKFYIGMHSTDDLEDGYKGSGKHLWYSIRKYGKENHKTEILEFLSSRKELKEREALLVNEELLGNALCMNLRTGGEGGGGWDHFTKDQFMAMHAKTVEARKKRYREDEAFRKHIQAAATKNLKHTGGRNWGIKIIGKAVSIKKKQSRR